MEVAGETVRVRLWERKRIPAVCAANLGDMKNHNWGSVISWAVSDACRYLNGKWTDLLVIAYYVHPRQRHFGRHTVHWESERTQGR
jgi:hypothetical protein